MYGYMLFLSQHIVIMKPSVINCFSGLVFISAHYSMMSFKKNKIKSPIAVENALRDFIYFFFCPRLVKMYRS